jgi:two-component system response regulator PilR (NtrC family)
MSAHRTLIIDDEPDIRELLELTLNRMGIDTDSAADLTQARELLQHNHYDLCLTDMRLPDGNGIELVEWIQHHLPNLPVAVITAHGNMELAVQALKAGAFDFVSKPVDLEDLRNLVQSALKLSSAHQGKNLRSRYELLGDSEPMQKIRGTIAKLARSQAPVFINGESGTGKELVARLIHNKGPRADHPFVPVNCGAIPSELMESEFFGHKKGSFTGAIQDKEGLFQAANGGTLFLDEVADLPMAMQVKLLRAIQEKAVRPVGAQKEIHIDVRILSATHKDLDQQVADGHFRQDLYYRLHVIQLTVPPLRERVEDIELLSRHILNKIASAQSEKPHKLGEDAKNVLHGYSFPGNVRELENIIERAIALSEGNIIQPEDLQLPEHRPASELEDASQLEDYLDDKEKQAIIQALEKTRYNKTAAAKLLGISFRQLRYRIKKLNME